MIEEDGKAVMERGKALGTKIARYIPEAQHGSQTTATMAGAMQVAGSLTGQKQGKAVKCGQNNSAE